jgi:hypothetical protein
VIGRLCALCWLGAVDAGQSLVDSVGHAGLHRIGRWIAVGPGGRCRLACAGD